MTLRRQSIFANRTSGKMFRRQWSEFVYDIRRVHETLLHCSSSLYLFWCSCCCRICISNHTLFQASLISFYMCQLNLTVTRWWPNTALGNGHSITQRSEFTHSYPLNLPAVMSSWLRNCCNWNNVYRYSSTYTSLQLYFESKDHWRVRTTP